MRAAGRGGHPAGAGLDGVAPVAPMEGGYAFGKELRGGQRRLNSSWKVGHAPACQ